VAKTGPMKDVYENGNGYEFFWSCFTFPKHPYWLWDPTQFHIQWVPETLSLALVWPAREADKLSPSNAEIRNKQRCISLSRVKTSS